MLVSTKFAKSSHIECGYLLHLLNILVWNRLYRNSFKRDTIHFSSAVIVHSRLLLWRADQQDSRYLSRYSWVVIKPSVWLSALLLHKWSSSSFDRGHQSPTWQSRSRWTQTCARVSLFAQFRWGISIHRRALKLYTL